MKRKTLPSTGRPREFDAEEVLHRALLVFWRLGYEGASLPDLTRAMKINRPSLYAAFGNKESLFRKAVERYEMGPAGYFRNALARTSAAEVVEALLHGVVDLVAKPPHPGGCLLVQGALTCGDSAVRIRRYLAERREGGVTAITRRFRAAIAEGDLPPKTDAKLLARLVVTVMNGLAVQAASGANHKDLRHVADMFLRTWSQSLGTSVLEGACGAA